MGRRIDHVDDPDAPPANSVVPSVVAVVREVREETGYDVEVTGLVGTYTNPNHRMAYDDGEVRQQFSIVGPRRHHRPADAPLDATPPGARPGERHAVHRVTEPTLIEKSSIFGTRRGDRRLLDAS